MMKPLRRACAALFALLAFALPAAATTYSTDYTDLWYAGEGESGWGVNLIQQNDTIFATLFVYGAGGASGNPAQWFVAPDVEPASTGNQIVFTGQLYQTTGPSYTATTFNPALVTKAVVGTITFTFTSDTTGVLQYTVNGIAVTKNIVRQTWKNNPLAGAYLGGLTATGTNCTGGVANGPILIFETLTVQESTGQTAMTVDFTANNGQRSQCVFAGPYSQSGKLGSIDGNWNCTLGSTAANAGTFTMSAIEANQDGLSARFHGQDQFCTYDGHFGGVRDVPHA